MGKINNRESTVVIGMGLAGLLCAYNLLAQKQHIMLIDTREEDRLFTRKQPIVLPAEFLSTLVQDITNYGANGYKIIFPNEYNGQYEFSLQQKTIEYTVTPPEISPLDREFFAAAKAHHRALPIYVIQEYLLKKLKEKDLEINGDESVLDIVNPANILYLNSSSGMALIKLTNEYIEAQFDNIIIATGSNRDFLKRLLNIEILKEINLPTPRNKIMKCGTMHLEYTGPISTDLITTIRNRPRIGPLGRGISNMHRCYLNALQTAGWHEQYLPLYFTTSNCDAQKLEFNFAGEIPLILYNETPEEFLTWAKTILKCEYPNLDTDYLRLSTYDYNPCLTFVLRPSYIEQAFYQKIYSRIFIIGDALLKANFFMGHGLENAALGAKIVNCCFKDGVFVSAESMQSITPLLCKKYAAIDRHIQLVIYLRENPIQFELFFGALDVKQEAKNTLAWLFKAQTLSFAPTLKIELSASKVVKM